MELELKFGKTTLSLDLSASGTAPTVLAGKSPPKLDDPMARVLEGHGEPHRVRHHS